MIQYIKKQLSHFEWYFVCLFFIALPLIYSTKLLDPALYSRFYALSFFVVLLTVLLGVLLFLKRFKFRLTKTDRWIFSLVGLFVIWHFIAISGAVNIKEAIFQSLKEATLMLSFFYFYQLLRNNNFGRELIIKSIIIMSSIFIGIALFELSKADFSIFFNATSHKGYYLNQALQGVNSTFSGKNLFPMGLVLMLPFTIYSVFFFNKFWKALSLVNIVLSLFFVFILSSKSAWFYAALFFGVLYVFYAIYRIKVLPNEKKKAADRNTKLYFLILPVVLVFVAIFLIAKSDVAVFSFVKDKVLQVVSPEHAETQIYSSDHPTSAQTRNLVWAQSLHMALDNPILGVGPGNWRIHQPAYGLNAYEDKVRQGEKLFQRPHNDFLWIASETGFIGLIAYVLIYLLILFQAYNNFIRSSDNKVKLFNALAFAALLGFAAIMLLSFPRERIALNMVYLMLFALVLSDAPFKSKEEECETSPILSYGVIAFLLGVLSFNLYVARDIYKGEQAARFIKIGVLKENWKLVLRAALSTEGTYYTLDPTNVPMQYYKGISLAKMNQKQLSKNAFQEAIALCPNNLRPLNNLGASLQLLGETDSAVMYFERALEISPRYKDALVNLAIVTIDFENLKKSFPHLRLNELKRYDDAMAYLKRVEDKNYVPKKFDEAVLLVSKVQAHIISNQLDRDKLLAWATDDKKVKNTFLRFQKENVEFRQILITELGKN